MRLKTWVKSTDWHLVASYYGKKDKEQKAAIVQEFKEGEKRMIVATKAFGMGVDISDIDRVYHVCAFQHICGLYTGDRTCSP